MRKEKKLYMLRLILTSPRNCIPSHLLAMPVAFLLVLSTGLDSDYHTLAHTHIQSLNCLYFRVNVIANAAEPGNEKPPCFVLNKQVTLISEE